MSDFNQNELINSIAPVIRMTVKNDKQLAIIRHNSEQATDSVDISLSVDTSEDDLIAVIKKFFRENPNAASVTIDGIGKFDIICMEMPSGRVAGKVVIVTGAAQGFGLEISQHLLAEGACVILADINGDLLNKHAESLTQKYGDHRVLGVRIDVTKSRSVKEAIDRVVKEFGGFDVFISNAGVLKAQSVKTQPEEDFDLTTNVNYKGYYLCTQAASKILAVQHKTDLSYISDIIQINSKSGLCGSQRNFAYAGSKFGGIGLTQSFALELIEDGIKVNSICPGNFFDGPLWSDPQNGLFVQYLSTNKVPGAKTIEDVRKAYEQKIPMKRGCSTPDVVKAIYYIIEQNYETGQALPVTGGQIMLH
jgi:NAD(P)-dependent dehydrogenase (short-subunit alcohol dehydrogenase family)